MMEKKFMRKLVASMFSVGVLCFAPVVSQAAVTIVPMDTQTSVSVSSGKGLESLGSSTEAKATTLEKVQKGGMEKLGSSFGNQKILDDGVETTIIFTSDRSTGAKSAWKMESYSDYKALLDSLDTGTILVLTSPMQTSMLQKYAAEQADNLARTQKGITVTFAEVTSVTEREKEIFSKYTDISKDRIVSIQKQYNDKEVKYNDGRTKMDRTMETINNAVGVWNMIDSIRRR